MTLQRTFVPDAQRHPHRVVARPLGVRRFAAAFLTAAVLAWCATPTQADILTDRFPDDTVLYFGWSGLQSQRDKLDKTALTAFYADPEVQRFTRGELPKVVAQLRQLMAQALPGEANEAIELALTLATALRDRPMALGLIDVEPSNAVALPVVPNFALVVDLGDSPARQPLNDLLAKMEATIARDAPPDTLKILPDGTRQAASPDGAMTLTWGLVDAGRTFGLAVGPRGAAVIRTPKAPKPLSANPQWGKLNVHAKLDSSLLCLYLNSEPLHATILPKLTQRFPQEVAQFSKVFTVSFSPTSVVATASTVSVEGPGFRTRVVAIGPAIKPQPPLRPEDYRIVPHDAQSATLTRLNLTETISAGVEAIKTQLPEPQLADMIAEQIRQAEAKLGLQIQADILDPFGKATTLALFDGPPQLPFVGGFTVVATVADAQRLKATFDKLTTLANEELDKLKGGPSPLPLRIRTLTNATTKHYFLRLGIISPTLAIADNHVIFNLFPQSAQEVADRLADPAAKGLADNPAFIKVATVAGMPASVSSLNYSDSTGFYSQLHSAVLLASRVVSLVTPMIEINFDSATLPPGHTLTSRLFPSLGYTHVEEGLTYQEGYGPIPFGEAVPAVVAIVAVGAITGGVMAATFSQQQIVVPALEQPPVPVQPVVPPAPGGLVVPPRP